MYMAVSRRAIPSAHPQTPGARPARSVSKSHPRLARRGRSCAEGAAPRAEAPLRFQVRAKLCYQRRACLPIPRLRLRAAPADVSRGASFRMCTCPIGVRRCDGGQPRAAQRGLRERTREFTRWALVPNFGTRRRAPEPLRNAVRHARRVLGLHATIRDGGTCALQMGRQCKGCGGGTKGRP